MVMTTSPGRASEPATPGTSSPAGANNPVRRGRDRVGDQRAGHAGLGVLAGPVDVQHDDLVGQAERRAELGGEERGCG